MFLDSMTYLDGINQDLEQISFPEQNGSDI